MNLLSCSGTFISGFIGEKLQLLVYLKILTVRKSVPYIRKPDDILSQNNCC